MKFLVDRVEGTWTFDEVGTGSRITWSWVVHSKGPVGSAAMPAARSSDSKRRCSPPQHRAETFAFRT